VKKQRRNIQRVGVRHNHLVAYPTPSNRSYHWGYGSIAGRMRVVQMVTGVFLAIHYVPNVARAFDSMEHVIREVEYGWRVRYMHANGASYFFRVLNRHRRRGRYYGSYVTPREGRWSTGVRRYLRVMATGFIGYVLPFGQMSRWGATVITSFASAIPGVGRERVEWLWGGYSVANATLNRFYAIHYRRPFRVAGRAVLHRVRLHGEGVGSGNPLGVDGNGDRIRFYPYFYVKDRRGLRRRWRGYSRTVYYAPNRLGHADNYIEANSRATPIHIVPEWYFRTYYGILRSVPDKLRGVIAMRSAIRRRRTRPFTTTAEVRSATFRPRYRQRFWRYVVTVLRLGWVGQKVVAYPYTERGQLGTVYYFVFRRGRVPRRGRREGRRMRW
jgi:ubiquinol-cytochrome c reductase cytochrome b subunit